MLDSLKEKDRTTGDLNAASMLAALPPHLLKPNPYIFYADFTLCVLIGNAALVAAAWQTAFSPLQLILLFTAALTLYRASVFIHEIVHSGKKIRWFALYYNLLHGFLHKLPHYCYVPHLEHHQIDKYGRSDDAEYERLGKKSRGMLLVVFSILAALPLPLVSAWRWGIFPILLPFIGKRGRDTVYDQMSFLGFNIRYRRGLPSDADRRAWYMQDAGGVIYTAITAWLIYTHLLPLQILPLWYAAMAIGYSINFYRTIMVHRYYGEFDPMNRKQMVLDSVTLPRTLLNVLVFPLGTGYHALHHLFPQIPYHYLDKAHACVMQHIPEDHPYRVTVISSYRQGLRAIVSGTY